MARATRSKPKAKEPTPEPVVSTTKPLPESTSNPPKLFVLPKDTSKDARIVTLENPASGAPSRYFFCPDKGFHEFTRIAAPKKDCRSWLITSDDDAPEEQQENSIGSGYMTQSADLFLATPIDLLFLILPALAPPSAKDTKQHFLALDDYLDKLSASSRHWRALLAQHASLKPRIESKMRSVCATVDAGDEPMFRLCAAKLLALVSAKAARMAQHSLPPSMEDKFVTTALEVPVMNVKREDPCPSNTDIEVPADESQSPQTTLPSNSFPTPPSIPPLLRLRTSLTYLSTSYLPPPLRPIIHTHLDTSPTFHPLTSHLAALAQLRSEAAALRSISDNMSRKRGLEEDEERIAEREEKKRKKEEEERKRKGEGRGVKMLKKVDTSGMKKMSAFFAKVAKKA